MTYWSDADKRAITEDPHFLRLIYKSNSDEYQKKEDAFLKAIGIETVVIKDDKAVRRAHKDDQETLKYYYERIEFLETLQEHLPQLKVLCPRWVYGRLSDGKSILLAIGEFDILKSRNRFELKHYIGLSNFALAHEGVHHVQIHSENNEKANEIDADMRGVWAVLEDQDLSSPQKIQTYKTTINSWQSFCAHHHSRANVEQVISGLKQSNIFRIAKESGLLEIVQSIEQQIQSLQTCERVCESELSSHPPCKHRTALLQQFIQQARAEQINDTIRDEIAWQ